MLVIRGKGGDIRGKWGTSYYALGTMVDVYFHLLGQGHSGIVHLPSVVLETCVAQ